jgi:hypothetical protein
MIIDRLATRLNKEDILIAHDFVKHDMNFTVRHAPRRRFPQGHMEQGGDLFRRKFSDGPSR